MKILATATNEINKQINLSLNMQVFENTMKAGLILSQATDIFYDKIRKNGRDLRKRSISQEKSGTQPVF